MTTTTATDAPARRRAVFLDVDGTLLQDGHHIPPSALAAIRAARAQGHLVFLSTGRGMAELTDILPVGFDGAVTNGGGFAAAGDRLVVERLFTPAEVERIERYLGGRGIHWYHQSYDRLFASPRLPELMARHLARDRAAARARAAATGEDPDDARFLSIGFKTFDDPSQFDATSVAKTVFLTDDQDAAARALADLAADFAVVGGTIPVSFGASGEVSPAGVSKGTAITELLAHLGIDSADAIGIGDNWNDVEMFEVCGTAIAMGNAVPEVQALADEVTTAIDDDGIHHAFVRHDLI